MITAPELARRIEVIESGYEFLLAYAAQGRQDDAGSEVRRTLTEMRAWMGSGIGVSRAARSAASSWMLRLF
jgi:hypothetical protein